MGFRRFYFLSENSLIPDTFSSFYLHVYGTHEGMPVQVPQLFAKCANSTIQMGKILLE